MKFKKEKQGEFNKLNFTPPPPHFSKILAVLLLFVGSDVLANPYVTLKHTGRNVISGCGNKSKFATLKVTAHNFPENHTRRSILKVSGRPEIFQVRILGLWYNFRSDGYLFTSFNLEKDYSLSLDIRIRANTNRINSNNRHNFSLEYNIGPTDYDLPPPVTIHLSPGTNQGCGPDQNLTLDEYAKSIPCNRIEEILNHILRRGENTHDPNIRRLNIRFGDCLTYGH